MYRNPDVIVANGDYDIGDIFVIDGYAWTIHNCYESPEPYWNGHKIIMTDAWHVSLSRLIHVPIYINYWNVYNYSFLNWNFLREERRSA